MSRSCRLGHRRDSRTGRSARLLRRNSQSPGGELGPEDESDVGYLRIQGPDHPDTLDARFGLARWRGEAGDAAGAAKALAELHTDHLRIQGPDYPHKLRTQNELAYWMAIKRGEAGDVDGAAEDLAALLVRRQQQDGPNHRNTLRTKNQLAQWRRRSET